MRIIKEIPQLVRAEVITQETADQILEYYANREDNAHHRLLAIFGILGAILIGLGIILIIAHNWDDLPRVAKTSFAFLPLLVGQVICGLQLAKNPNNVTWRESGTVFLFLAVGASISLVGQIYNIHGDLGYFVQSWMWLCLPLVYVMRSSMASLLFVIGITFYGCYEGYGYKADVSYNYWIMLVSIMPFYYWLYKRRRGSNFLTFHHWFIVLALLITLGTVISKYWPLAFLAYSSLFGLFYLIGNAAYFKEQHAIINAYKIMGSLGTVILLIVMSFNWIWDEIRTENLDLKFMSAEVMATSMLTLAGGVMLMLRWTKRDDQINPLESVFMLFLLIFLIGLSSSFAVVLTNILVLGLGITTVLRGAKQDHFGILNYGLLVITALVVCRFFDTDLSFVVRGFLFLAVGVSFFVANYMMIQKRKTDE